MNIVQRKILPTTHGEHVLHLPVGAEILCVEPISGSHVAIHIRTDSVQRELLPRHFFIGLPDRLVPSIDEAEFIGSSMVATSQIFVFVSKAPD